MNDDELFDEPELDEGSAPQEESAVPPAPPALTREDIAAVMSEALQTATQRQPEMEEPMPDFSGVDDPFEEARINAIRVIQLQEDLTPSEFNGVALPDQIRKRIKSEVRKITDPNTLIAARDQGWVDMMVKAELYEYGLKNPSTPSVGAEPVTASPGLVGGASESDLRELESVLGVKITKQDIEKYG
jgi:hypothetical protein